MLTGELDNIKHLKVTYDTWYKLKLLQVERHCRTMNDLIISLVEVPGDMEKTEAR